MSIDERVDHRSRGRWRDSREDDPQGAGRNDPVCAARRRARRGDGPRAGGGRRGQEDRLHGRRPPGHRQHEPDHRDHRRRVRGLEPSVPVPHQQGGQGLRDHPRPGHLLEELRGRPHLDLQDAPGHEVVGRQAPHRRGRGLDDQHLPQGGVDQPLRGHRQPEGGGQGRHHAGHHLGGAGSQASGPGRVHHAQAHLRPDDRRRTGEGPGRAGRGRRPVRAGEVREGPVRARSLPTRTSTGASRPSTRWSCASSTTGTRWWPP